MVWIDTMMKEELGLETEQENAFLNGIVSCLSFIVFGFIPAIPFVIGN